MTTPNTFKDQTDLPPAGFDPVNKPADRAKLEHYWLPAMPDPALKPTLYEHWQEMLSLPLTYVAPQSTPAPAGTNTALVPGQVASGNLQSSFNWSGTFLEANGARSFARITGAWTVPTVTAGTRAPGDAQDVPFRCSIWIGIDGKKPFTKSMPQVGSAQWLAAPGAQAQGLWWQWWRRGYSAQDGLPYDMKGVPVSPGDRVLFNITAVAPNRVWVNVANRTTNTFATVEVTGGEPIVGDTAEWIVERPADFALSTGAGDPGPLFPLPNYSHLTIDKCATDYSIPSVTSWVPQFVQMIQAFPNPNRTAVISKPSTIADDGKVELRYQAP
jgi:hypothetical protein